MHTVALYHTRHNELQIRQIDATGIEPRKLFVVCDYMMNDKNGDGVVAMDEV